MTERLVDKSAELLASHTSRRGFLFKSALVGSAFVVSPLRYLLRPGSAWSRATCINCPQILEAGVGSIGSGPTCCDSTAPCCDGYTTFCCTINGGSNSCPSGTIIGGWWKCDQSNPFCAGSRYYIDCNASCNSNSGCFCPSGSHDQDACNGVNPWCGTSSARPSYSCINFSCQCAGGACGNRGTACNWFRYGQCNRLTPCAGPVVCRVSTCTAPYVTYSGCDNTSCTDNTTCSHTASCL